MKKEYIRPLTLWSSIKTFPFEINYFFIRIKFFLSPASNICRYKAVRVLLSPSISRKKLSKNERVKDA